MKQTITFLLLTIIATLLNAQDINDRIVGGSNVGLGQIPSHASLRTLNNVHFCGGSIVSIRWIATAAHCTINRSQNGINVVVGTVTLNSGGVTHRSMRIVQHPEFNVFTLLNDVSLIQIETTFTLNANVQMINLGIIVLGAGVNVELAGFGSTEASGPLSNNLQRITASTLTNADCTARLTNQNLNVGASKFCTLARAGVGTCSGDGGGPVIYQTQLVGIISWNVPCAMNFPDGHERISHHRQWILSVIS